MIAALLLGIVATVAAPSEVSVQSRELDFRATLPFEDEDQGRSFRSMAHAIAIGQVLQDSARNYSCEAGTSPRTGIRLDAHGRLRAADPDDVNAFWILKRCGRADFDSTCDLWTCEFGRFRTEDEARDFGMGPTWMTRTKALRPARGMNAALRWILQNDACAPGSFVVRVAGAKTRPYARRVGLYFTREDAERAARGWSGECGGPVRVVRQRVDGSILEMAFTEEC